MASIVADTSIVVKWFVHDEPLRDRAIALRRAFIEGLADAVAPAHMPIELATALTRATRRGRYDGAEIPAAIEAIGAFEFDTADIVVAAVQAAELASMMSIHPADALFIVTALARDATLVTADLRLLEAARAAGCNARGLHEIDVADGGSIPP